MHRLPPLTPSESRLLEVFTLVEAERNRQEQLKAEGKFLFTCADDAMADTERLAVLTEEVGEVAREVLELQNLVEEKGDVDRLRTELVQVAAIAVAWVEAL